MLDQPQRWEWATKEESRGLVRMMIQKIDVDFVIWRYLPSSSRDLLSVTLSIKGTWVGGPIFKILASDPPMGAQHQI